MKSVTILLFLCSKRWNRLVRYCTLCKRTSNNLNISRQNVFGHFAQLNQKTISLPSLKIFFIVPLYIRSINSSCFRPERFSIFSTSQLNGFFINVTLGLGWWKIIQIFHSLAAVVDMCTKIPKKLVMLEI